MNRHSLHNCCRRLRNAVHTIELPRPASTVHLQSSSLSSSHRLLSTNSSPSTSSLRRQQKQQHPAFLLLQQQQQQHTGSSSPTSPHSRTRAISIGAALFVGAVGYGVALAFPPPFYKLLNPTPVGLQPAAHTPEGKAQTHDIETQLQNLPIVKQLREETLLVPSSSSSDSADNTSPNVTSSSSLTQEQTSRPRKWKEYRPYSKMPEDRKRHSLTQYTLRGPGKFAVTPILFASHDEKESIAILHVGNSMCGHNGIVHGGLLATILDEAVARPAFFALPNKIGMTVYLNTRYKAPTMAEQFLVVKTKCVKAEGRKAFVEGHIEDLQGNRLVECDALYVEPKNAWMLQTSAVKEALA